MFVMSENEAGQEKESLMYPVGQHGKFIILSSLGLGELGGWENIFYRMGSLRSVGLQGLLIRLGDLYYIHRRFALYKHVYVYKYICLLI